MRNFTILILIVACLGSAYAFELGNQQRIEKDNSHVGLNPGTPNTREGGEDMETAFPIPSIPFYDTGNTSNHINDYDEACPYDTSTAPDLVYKYQPTTDIILSVDLCGSGYDTKTYIYEGSGNLVFCNDDFYQDETCGQYVSLIEQAFLFGGLTYYFVIDGYGEDSGDYILNISEYIPLPPCVLTCDGINEGEPPLVDGYEDAYNGGCNSPDFGNPFLDLTDSSNSNGELNLCGKSGWYSAITIRDTDWMYIQCGELGLIEWTLDAELPVFGFLLGGNCTDGATVDEQITAGPCAPATMLIQGNPGDVIMVWVGPTEYSGPGGFSGPEFDYVALFSGLDANGWISTENLSLDSIKSLYR